MTDPVIDTQKKASAAQKRRDKAREVMVKEWEARRRLYADHIIPLWLAHCRGQRGMPETGRLDRIDELTYKGMQLFRRGTLIAQQFTKPEPTVQVFGVPNKFVVSTIVDNLTAKNGPIVWAQNDKFTRTQAVRALNRIREVAFYSRAGSADRTVKDKALEAQAKNFLAFNSKIAVAIRAKYEALSQIYFAANFECNHAAYNRSYPDSKRLEYLGHTPQPGEMFKRLRQRDDRTGFYAYRGGYVYPPVGEWTPTVPNTVEACANGYHLVKADFLGNWRSHGDHVFLAEGDGAKDERPDKTAFARVRLVKYIGDIGQVTQAQMEAKFDPADADKLAALEKAAKVALDAREQFYAKNRRYIDRG